MHNLKFKLNITHDFWRKIFFCQKYNILINVLKNTDTYTDGA